MICTGQLRRRETDCTGAEAARSSASVCSSIRIREPGQPPSWRCFIFFCNSFFFLFSCTTACDHHQKLIRNLVSVLANKILLFNEKITHISKRTTREKLLSYLSAESIRQSSLSFDIPFDRQQLADFLCVERAAMSVELSKLQKEGLLVTRRNHFELLTH